MSNIDKDTIINFISACNELVNGKFILADIKISKILRAISESTDIYNLIAENMINYDFDKEFAKAVVKDSQGIEKFVLPEEDEKIIPLVFCLLVELDSKRINFNDFIKAQFPLATNQNEEYVAFAKTIIIPFRNAVANYFGLDPKEVQENPSIEDEPLNNIIDEKLKEHLEKAKEVEAMMRQADDEDLKTVTVINSTVEIPVSTQEAFVEAVYESQRYREEQEEVELLFKRIGRLSRILEDKLVYVRNPLKKSNITLLLDALYEACEIKNVKIIVAVVMALNTIAGNERSMRAEIKELNTICYDFYE
ncbi:MAG: hypothetical protein IJB10_01645 [Clostridia bacterium]|nr:hypothetical protein [Clostridia bacterium]